jgi:hypothetical protein
MSEFSRTVSAHNVTTCININTTHRMQETLVIFDHLNRHSLLVNAFLRYKFIGRYLNFQSTPSHKHSFLPSGFQVYSCLLPHENIMATEPNFFQNKYD